MNKLGHNNKAKEREKNQLQVNLPFDNFESGNSNFQLLKRHHHRRGGGTKEPFSGFYQKRVATFLHFFSFFFYNLVGGKSLPFSALQRNGQLDPRPFVTIVTKSALLVIFQIQFDANYYCRIVFHLLLTIEVQVRISKMILIKW